MEERLQKILAQAGIASRRASEELILAGRVRVNNSVAELGQKADLAKDKITLDGRVIHVEQRVYIALHKPRFVLSTVEPEPGDARPTVRDLVPVGERVYPVGRLDFESEGLVLMTNDGELANQLAHPMHGHEKEYRVLLADRLDGDQLAAWRRGVVLEDGYKTQPADVYVESTLGKGCWVRVKMTEGRKRQIRETAARLGLPVVRIVRVRIGTLTLGSLKPKEWRYLSDLEVKTLKGRPVQRSDKKPRTNLNRTHPPRDRAGQNQKRTSHRDALQNERSERRPRRDTQQKERTEHAPQERTGPKRSVPRSDKPKRERSEHKR